VSKSPLFELLDAINYTKEDIYNEVGSHEYKPYMINHFLSGNMDSVLYANEMNTRPCMDKQMQFDYLRFSLRKKKRYSKWLKQEKMNDIKYIMDYYNYSETKAREVIDLLCDEEINYIKDKLDRGGKK